VEGDGVTIPVNPKPNSQAQQLFGSTILEARPMKSNGSFGGKGRAWVPPTITKLAIGTETKSPVAVDQRIENAEPRPPATPASKFGFTLEWSFPMSARPE
jgi:hypothetical protein